MIFTVVWKKTAENSLADLWLRHPADRQAFTNAANHVDAILRINPQSKGDPHSKHARILQVPPLGITFQVNETDRLVRVLTAWYIPLFTTNGYTNPYTSLG